MTEASRSMPPSMLQDLSILLNQPFRDIQDCLPVMLPVITRQLGVQAAFVSHMTPTRLEFLGAVDTSNCGLLQADQEPLLNSFCQYIYATGEPIVVTDAAGDPRVSGVDLRTKFAIGSYLGVPLIRGSGAIDGSLCALDPLPRSYSPEQLAFLRIVASKLAWVMDQTPAPLAALSPAGPASDRADPALVLRVMAHDIRSPLTSMFGYCDLLLSGMAGSLTEEQQTMIDRMAEASRFIHRLATDMVASVDSQHATMMVLPARYDPVQVVQQLAAIYAIQAERKGLHFEVITTNAPATGTGDAARMQQVLANLIANAIQYTDHGGVSIEVTGWEGGVAYSVRDTGRGLAPAEQERIWALHARERHDQVGFGIGLYVVRQLVQAMGGRVALASAPGQGSTFTVRFPAVAQAPSAIAFASS